MHEPHRILGQRAYRLPMLVLAALVGGCAISPPYQEPALPAAAQGPFLNQSVHVQSMAQTPDDWWRLYDDPVLDQLITDALASNTTLREAVAHLRNAQAVLAEARGGLLPATSASAGATSGRNPAASSGPGLPAVQWTYAGQVGVSYEVDFFDRVDGVIQAAHADLQAQRAAHDAATVVVVAEVTRAYSDACAAASSAEVAQRSLDIAVRVLSMVRRRYEAGAVAQIDVQRADLAVAQARSLLPQWSSQHASALLSLAALLGRTPSEVPDSARRCSKPPNPRGMLPVGDAAELIRRRPDVRQAERQLAGDVARIGVAAADLYPRVTIGASGAYNRNGALKGSRSWSFGIGPLVSWTFPNRTAVKAQLEQAQANGAASLARFDGTVLTALKEAETALSAYSSAVDHRDALVEARAMADTVFQVAQQRFAVGAASEMALDQARAELVAIAAQVAAAEQRVGSSRVDVLKALGGGWASSHQ